ncbi:MAG: DUF6600 domain-containing protein [Bacteroidota bacterium]
MFIKCRPAFRLFIATLFVFLSFAAPKAVAQYDESYISYNDFYQNLAPYGQWVDDPQYGYVWSPNVDADFRPYYTNGNWVMTEYGNTWVSNYQWGWAAFHYGRWTYDNYYGWLWIPGSNWGPAWVSWRESDGYYGWAPLGPGYDVTATYTDYSCPGDWWVFIPPQYVYTGNYYRYWNGPRNNSSIITGSRVVSNHYAGSNVTYVSGPRQKDIEQHTNQPVQVYKITNSRNLNTRVHNNVVRMYRPAEIKQVAAYSGERGVPPDVVSAPRPVRASQPVSTSQTSAPRFRSEVPARRADPPGVTQNVVATPPPRPGRTPTSPRPMDYDRRPQQPERDGQPQQQEQPRQSQPAQQTTSQPRSGGRR